MERAMSHHARRADYEVRETTALIEENKEETARLLSEKRAKEHPDKPPVDFVALQDYVVDEYTTDAQFVFADDVVYMEARGVRDRAYGRVKTATKSVDGEFRYQRNGIIPNYGTAVADEVGVGATPDPNRNVALRQADFAADQMARPKMAEIQPLVGRGVLEWLEQSKSMRGVADKLRAEIGVYDKKKAVALSKKNALKKSSARYNATYGDMVGIQKRLYRQAGLNELVDKLSQIRRKSWGRPSPETAALRKAKKEAEAQAKAKAAAKAEAANLPRERLAPIGRQRPVQT